MIRKADATERLYLSKRDNEMIYIENCKIPQHHIDGIRFLYKQYKKKKPGAIINDTTGYGKNLQIVLFLKAMCHLLEQPVLILCPEGAEHGWMEQFQTWTDLCDDVVLETKKPHIKKQILINTMSNLSTFCSRNWSILVVDVPEIDKTTLQILGLPFKADFKIWVTSSGIKDNLDDFSRIYKWFYPKGEFDKKGFLPDKNNPYDVVDKAILLDAFMEDIVAKIEDTQTSVEYNEVDESPPRKISLKNKDATGTKIKRSKRKIYEDDDDDIPLSKTARDITNTPTFENENKEIIFNNQTENTTVNNEKEEILPNNCEDDDDFSIDNFKKTNKESNDITFNTPTFENENKEIIFNNQTENTTVNNEKEEILPNNCEDDDDFSIDNFKKTNKESNDITFNEESDTEMKIDTADSESENKLYYEPDSSTDDRVYEMDTLVDEQNINIEEPEKNIDETNLEEGEDLVKENNTDLDNENANDIDKETQNNNNNNLIYENDDKEIVDNNTNENRESPSICDELKPVNDSNNGVLNEVNMKSDENKEKSVKSPVRSNVDQQMKEMEEKVFKKFKGSLLDSLF